MYDFAQSSNTFALFARRGVLPIFLPGVLWRGFLHKVALQVKKALQKFGDSGFICAL